ncbi:MAG: hypothetical protein HY748_09085 [Elusimicrobia bacterium]|nr:hypothetical protein [Elusimicrobiota bacterium]
MRFSEINKKRKAPEPDSQDKDRPKQDAPQTDPQKLGSAKTGPAKPSEPRPRDRGPKSIFSPRAVGTAQAPGQPRTQDAGKPMPGQQSLPKTPGLRVQFRAAQECYGRMVSLVKEAADQAQDGAAVRDLGLSRAAADCVDLLQAQPFPLLALTARSTASNYLYGHSANVCALSTYLALGLGWDKEPVRRLGLAALLHELRLARLLGLPMETGSPTAEEEREAKLHPTDSPALKQHLLDLEETAKRRENGAPEPVLAAHIIGICDIYEALSHYRAWREPMLPHEAVRVIVKAHAADFDRAAKHLFLGRLTLYPPGSYVQLSGGAIAAVSTVDQRTPTLPTVSVRLSSDGVLLDPPQTVELATNSLVHIERPVDETKLDLKDKKVLMAFEAERWWVG